MRQLSDPSHGYHGHIPTTSDMDALRLAEAVIDAGPESMISAAEYLWVKSTLPIAEMKQAGGWLREIVTPESEPWCKPELSDLTRPIIVSYGDRERCPVNLWDGCHRSHAAAMLGHASLPCAIGLRLTFQDSFSIDMGETPWTPTHWQVSLGSRALSSIIVEQSRALHLDPQSPHYSENRFAELQRTAQFTKSLMSAYEARAATSDRIIGPRPVLR